MDKRKHMKTKFYKLPDPTSAVTEIVQRIEAIEVKGDSVEHLFRIKIALKQMFQSMEEIKEKEGDEKEANEGG